LASRILAAKNSRKRVRVRGGASALLRDPLRLSQSLSLHLKEDGPDFALPHDPAR
jgi:hypothetical protein